MESHVRFSHSVYITYYNGNFIWPWTGQSWLYTFREDMKKHHKAIAKIYTNYKLESQTIEEPKEDILQTNHNIFKTPKMPSENIDAANESKQPKNPQPSV